jgi:chromosome segregation ATPase
MASKQKDAGTAESVDYLALAERLDDRAIYITAKDFERQLREAAAALREAHAEIDRADYATRRAREEVERLQSELTSTQADARTLSADKERLRALLREARDIVTSRVQTPRIVESVIARIDKELAALGEKHD